MNPKEVILFALRTREPTLFNEESAENSENGPEGVLNLPPTLSRLD